MGVFVFNCLFWENLSVSFVVDVSLSYDLTPENYERKRFPQIKERLSTDDTDYFLKKEIVHRWHRFTQIKNKDLYRLKKDLHR